MYINNYSIESKKLGGHIVESYIRSFEAQVKLGNSMLNEISSDCANALKVITHKVNTDNLNKYLDESYEVGHYLKYSIFKRAINMNIDVDALYKLMRNYHFMYSEIIIEVLSLVDEGLLDMGKVSTLFEDGKFVFARIDNLACQILRTDMNMLNAKATSITANLESMLEIILEGKQYPILTHICRVSKLKNELSGFLEKSELTLCTEEHELKFKYAVQCLRHDNIESKNCLIRTFLDYVNSMPEENSERVKYLVDKTADICMASDLSEIKEELNKLLDVFNKEEISV